MDLRKDQLRRAIIFLIGLAFVSGCAKLRHMDQLLTLKGLADERDRMGQYVDGKDGKFTMMLKEIKAGTLGQYSDQRQVLRAFGEPVFVRAAGDSRQGLEVWLYRYATQYFGSEKIYLYFEKDGTLAQWEYREGENE